MPIRWYIDIMFWVDIMFLNHKKLFLKIVFFVDGIFVKLLFGKIEAERLFMLYNRLHNTIFVHINDHFSIVN